MARWMRHKHTGLLYHKCGIGAFQCQIYIGDTVLNIYVLNTHCVGVMIIFPMLNHEIYCPIVVCAKTLLIQIAHFEWQLQQAQWCVGHTGLIIRCICEESQHFISDAQAHSTRGVCGDLNAFFDNNVHVFVTIQI